jgi:hypothetical protein
MIGLTKKLEKWFSAVAFAEEGEHATAMQMVGIEPANRSESVGFVQSLETAFAAAAFAEADCRDMALEILDAGKKESFAEAVGLKSIRIWHATVPLEEESFLDVLGLRGARLRFCVAQF